MPEIDTLAPTAPSSSGVTDGALPSPPAGVDAIASPVPDRALAKRSLKPPKDSRVYKVAMAYIALKAQGLKLADISEQLSIPKDTISTYVKRAHRKGWIRAKELDVEDQTEISLPDQVVRNVGEFLESRDKDITIEAAKGLGIFKSHQAVKVDGQVGIGLALKVQVELPKGIEHASPVQIRPGSVGGTPAIDAEIVEEGS